jgi:hypothetical protein
MSIQDEVNDWCGRGRLFLVPMILGSPATRTMYLSSDLQAQVFGPTWPSEGEEDRWVALQADLDAYVEGQVLPVAKHPFRDGRDAYFKRLHEARDEVWEIRSRHPDPQIRIFGRFAEKDVFIAFTWAERAELRGPKSRAWRDAIVRCKTEWRRLFFAYDPFIGNDYNEYISNIILV